MLKIKRLHSFIIQTFFPVFMMTFGICLFIVLMQFLWKYVEDLVGKGLDNVVLAELFFYAALRLIPLALPLSILLASLMTFGSLGERLELLAVKAAGVSLLRVMKPLIIFITLISIGAFFFQNEAVPRINVKFSSLMISIKQKSPELEIPEGSFYNQISNYSLYVKHKDPETRMLHDVIIYDTSNGFDNMSVFFCDSAQMEISDNKDFLLLSLHHGQRFANVRRAALDDGSSQRDNKFVPYSRENFKEKKIIIPFDSDFKRVDEANLQGSQISQNIQELEHSIDSMTITLDSINVQDRQIMTKHTYLSYRSTDAYQKEKAAAKTAKAWAGKITFDSLMNTYSQDELIRIYSTAISDAENNNASYLFQSVPKIELQKKIRFSKVEWHQKFTLSFACLVFFFIGAPLGAIIRKGGLGMPVVTSVVFFIIYYIINNVGLKMARDGVWEVWQGIWLSSLMLFPLGIFLTYKAINDSALFNIEAYTKYIRKGLFIKNEIEIDKEIIPDSNSIPDLYELDVDTELLNNLQLMESDRLKDVARNFQNYGYDANILQVVLSILKGRGVGLIDVKIKNLDRKEVENSFALFIKNAKITIALYLLLIGCVILDIALTYSLVEWVTNTVLAVYTLFFVRTYIYYSDFNKSIDKKISKNQNRLIIASFTSFVFFYNYLVKKMMKDKNAIKWT